MDKNKIKSHLQSFLGEAEQKPIGLKSTENVQKKEKTVNNDYYKEVTKKMSEYDKESTSDGDSVKKGDLQKTDSEDEMDVNPNGMDQIQYDNDPGKRFKERAIEALEGSSRMGNKTYTGAENGNTEEVWGASGGKHTGKEIVKAAKRISKKDANPQEDAVGYIPSPSKTKLATENKITNNKTINKNKMKRLVFKESFNGLGGALKKIPSKYKVDNKIFEMTDGNENYKIRWEGTAKVGEPIVLVASDKTMMNEDINHMKHLMGFKSETTLGTPTSKERVSENTTFRDIMNLTNSILEGTEDGDKKMLSESAFAGHGFKQDDEEEQELDESKGENPDVATKGSDTKIGASADGIVRGSGHDKHVMETEELEEGEDITEAELDVNMEKDVTDESEEAEDVMEGFENPTTFKLSESDTQNMSAGTDLGTDVGATASGDPRGEGHDKEIMKEEDGIEVEVEVCKDEDEKED